MVNYHDWNNALISYFTKGIAVGSKIYITVDEDLIYFIGRKFLNLGNSINTLDYFKKSVIDAVIKEENVDLEPIKGFMPQDKPRCLAFLALSVLAASQMSADDEEEISEKDYFTRLRKLLNLSGEGRPNGMKSGSQSEEILWQEWNRWLLKHGFQSTAYQGKGGSQKYIKYPISQTLLRQVDKDKLQDLFIKKDWKTSWDAETLYTKVYQEIFTLSKHLQKLFQDRKRGELLAESIYDLHQQWLVEGCPSTTIKRITHRNWSHNLFAGIYRTEDPFLGEVEYYLYPKQQRGRELDSLKIDYQNNVLLLRKDRQGWFLPVENSLENEHLDNGLRLTITSENELEKLIFPARDFWILIPDPDEPESGIYTTWGSLELGQKFIILCKKDLLSDLELLQNEQLLKWEKDGLFYPFGKDSNWIEIFGCQILSQAWDGIFPSNLQLKNALQPQNKLSISLQNGLKIGHQKLWVKDYPPDIIVYGFYPRVELEIKNLITEEVIEKKSYQTNIPISIVFPQSGSYFVTASYKNEFAETLIRLEDWHHLEFANINNSYQEENNLFLVNI